MSKKTWIDLTDISVWSGHHTGTQRVVYEVSKSYEGNPDVGYFIFNPKKNTFHEYDFRIIRESVEASSKLANMEPEPTAPNMKQRVRHVAQRSYHYSPAIVKKRLTADRRKKIKKAIKATKQLVKPTKPVVVNPDTPAMHFGSEDVILILGKPWDYKNFIEVLGNEKKLYGFKVVEVVYDLMPVFFPHLFGQPLIKPYVEHMFESTALSDKLIAISESTKTDTLKFCEDMRLPAPPIEVVRLGDDFNKVTPQKPSLAGIESGNFILCVGTVEVRKNHQLLYMAYKEGQARGVEMPKLVIVGGKGWYTEDVQYAFKNDPTLKDNVHIGGRTDSELEWLYENCLFSIYPSVYEGWGLPIAESLARGKVCIASHASSMTEIAGDLIEYFSPYDSSACLELITKYMNEGARAKKEVQIKKSYKPITWTQTTNEVKQAIKDL